MNLEGIIVNGKVYRPLKGSRSCNNCKFLNESCTIETNRGPMVYCNLFKDYPLQEDRPKKDLLVNSIVIGNQIWSDLLDLDVPGCKQVDGITYYTYEQALGAANIFTNLYGEGWKLPTREDFIELTKNVVYDPNKLVKLGFIRAGYYFNGSVYGKNEYGNYWSRTCSISDKAYHIGFNKERIWAQRLNRKYYGFPIRCIKDL